MGDRQAAAEAAQALGREIHEFEVIGQLVRNDEPLAIGDRVSMSLADAEILIAAGRLKPAPAAAPSNGLTVAQLKEALDAKGVAYPADAKKAELAALLDAPAPTDEGVSGASAGDAA